MSEQIVRLLEIAAKTKAWFERYGPVYEGEPETTAQDEILDLIDAVLAQAEGKQV